MSFDLKIKNGDISIAKDGDFEKVENTDKLIQDILKIALTPLGSNKHHPYYGSLIGKSTIGKPFDMEFLSSMASNHLKNSLETLQKLQRIQARFQRVTPSEQLAAIQQTILQRNNIDPRFFEVIIKVLSNALTPVTTGFVVNPL